MWIHTFKLIVPALNQVSLLTVDTHQQCLQQQSNIPLIMYSLLQMDYSSMFFMNTFMNLYVFLMNTFINLTFVYNQFFQHTVITYIYTDFVIICSYLSKHVSNCRSKNYR